MLLLGQIRELVLILFTDLISDGIGSLLGTFISLLADLEVLLIGTTRLLVRTQDVADGIVVEIILQGHFLQTSVMNVFAVDHVEPLLVGDSLIEVFLQSPLSLGFQDGVRHILYFTRL